MSQYNDIEKVNAYFTTKQFDDKAQNPLSQNIVNTWKQWYSKLGFLAKTLSADTLHTALKLQNTFAYSMGDEYSSYGSGMVSGFGADQMQASFFSQGQGDYVTSAYGHSITVGRGSKGQQVAAWQTIIGVKADGDFGPATEAATKKWQSAHGLVADGVAGPASWAAASSVVTPAVANVLQVEAAKEVPFGVPPNASIDLGDVDAVGFVTPPTVVAVNPLQEAGLLGTLENLPTWAKVILGVGAVGSTLYYTPKKYGGLGK